MVNLQYKYQSTDNSFFFISNQSIEFSTRGILFQHKNNFLLHTKTTYKLYMSSPPSEHNHMSCLFLKFKHTNRHTITFSTSLFLLSKTFSKIFVVLYQFKVDSSRDYDIIYINILNAVFPYDTHTRVLRYMEIMGELSFIVASRCCHLSTTARTKAGDEWLVAMTTSEPRF